MGLDRVTIKLSDAGLAAQYQCYLIFPIKNQPETYNEASMFLWQSAPVFNIYLNSAHDISKLRI